MSNKTFKVMIVVLILVALIGVGIIVIPPILQDKQLTEEAGEYDDLLSRVASKPSNTAPQETEASVETEIPSVTEAPTEAITVAEVTSTPEASPTSSPQVSEEPEETSAAGDSISEWKPFANAEKNNGIMIGQQTTPSPYSGNGVSFGKYSDNPDNISPVDNPDKYNAWLIDKNKTPTPEPEATPTPTPTPAPRIGRYTEVDLTECKKINDDFIAWIKVPNTNIDYPIVQSNDTDYYLEHTFEGNQSKLGTLLSLGKTNWKRPSQNIVIYGHHVEGSGDKMFKALLKYKDSDYYPDHSVIYLDSIYMDGKYKIFSVFDIHEGDIDPSVSNFASGEEFLDFVYAAKDLSLYDTNVVLNEEDQIITLVTCDRYFQRGIGRLVVMAVKEG